MAFSSKTGYESIVTKKVMNMKTFMVFQKILIYLNEREEIRSKKKKRKSEKGKVDRKEYT